MQLRCVNVAFLQLGVDVLPHALVDHGASLANRPRGRAPAVSIVGMRAEDTVLLRKVFPDGVATVQQLVASGVPERTAYHRCLDGGPWQNPLPGVVFLFTGEATRRQLVIAALALAGPGAVVTGIEGCRRHGLRRGPRRLTAPRDLTDVVHLLVHGGRQIRDVDFVHVERTSRLPQPHHRDGIPLAPLVRCCVDAARRLRREGDIAELLSDAVQRGMCTVAQLVLELDSGSRRHTALPRRVLGEVSVGIRSAAELSARTLWSSTGLPEPWWNVAVHTTDGAFLGIADCWVDDVAMVWEIESTQWHMSPRDHDRTVERAARFVAAGAVYVASKPKRVVARRPEIVQMLRDTYRHAAARPRPGLRATPPDPLAGKPRSCNGAA